MNKARKLADVDMLPEYDFSGAVRGKYHDQYHRSSNVVVLDEDVAELFPNAEAVNGALRALAAVAKRARVEAKPSVAKRREKGVRRKGPVRPKTRS